MEANAYGLVSTPELRPNSCNTSTQWRYQSFIGKPLPEKQLKKEKLIGKRVIISTSGKIIYSNFLEQNCVASFVIGDGNLVTQVHVTEGCCAK